MRQPAWSARTAFNAGAHPLAAALPDDIRGGFAIESWQPFLRALRERIECDGCALVVQPRAHGDAPRALCDADDAHSRLADALRDAASVDALADGLQRIGDFNAAAGEAEPDEKAATPSDRRGELLRSSGLAFQLGLLVDEEEMWRCHLHLFNSRRAGAFGQAARGALLELLPHLQRALTRSMARLRHERETMIYRAAFDGFALGALTLDGAGRILEINPVGRRILERCEGLVIRNRTLLPARAEQRAALQRALRAAAALAPETGTLVDALRLEFSGGQRLRLLVYALPRPQWYEAAPTPAAAVYFDAAPTADLSMPVAATARLFGLTPSEARLAILLARGFTLAEAGQALGITDGTVRAGMKRLFEKTGVNRQVDLVRLMLRSVAPLAGIAMPGSGREEPVP